MNKEGEFALLVVRTGVRVPRDGRMSSGLGRRDSRQGPAKFEVDVTVEPCRVVIGC